MAGDEDKAIKAGCIGYITKPINTRMFLKSISPYLN
jgi:AmiR/NasT family two-component response regulator